MKIVKKILVISLLSVVTLSAEDAKNIKSTKDVNRTTSTNEMKTVFFPIKHYHSAVVRTKIKAILGREARVMSFKFNNMLVLRAYPQSIKRVQEVIKKIDSVKPLDTTVVKLKKTPVQDVYQEIKAMSKALFHQEIIGEQVKVIDSNATNSLILVGKKENMDRLVKYIELLDIEGGVVSKSID